MVEAIGSKELKSPPTGEDSNDTPVMQTDSFNTLTVAMCGMR